MSVNMQDWQAEIDNGLILVTVPGCNWTRTCHDWELHRMRNYLRNATHIPVETRLAIFAWLEQVEAVIDAERPEPSPLESITAEAVCNFVLGLTVLGLLVCGFLLAGGVL